MYCYWGIELRRKRRDKVKGGSPGKVGSQQCGTEVHRIDCGGSKYLLGEDVGIGNDGGDEGWFLLMEERVCDQHYTDTTAESRPH